MRSLDLYLIKRKYTAPGGSWVGQTLASESPERGQKNGEANCYLICTRRLEISGITQLHPTWCHHLLLGSCGMLVWRVGHLRNLWIKTSEFHSDVLSWQTKCDQTQMKDSWVSEDARLLNV